MFNMSEKDPVNGWEGVKPSIHPINRLYALSLSAWKISAQMIDDGRDYEDIKRMQDTAVELEKYARFGEECTCTPRDYTCKICAAIARIIYNDEFDMI